MEDILASIRRILNEDDAPPAAAGPAAPLPAASPPPVAMPSAPPPPVAMPSAPPARPAPPVPEKAENEEPFELTESMLLDPEPAKPPAPPPVPPPIERPRAAPEPAVEVAAPAPDQALLAPAAAAAATASVGQLLRTVAAERNAAVHRGGPTIEEVVREELRPLLKDWLDAHLPALVDRLVRAEIERVVGRDLS